MTSTPSDCKFKPIYKLHRRIAKTALGDAVLDGSCPEKYASDKYTIREHDFDTSNFNGAVSEFLGEPFYTDARKRRITVDELPGLTIVPQFFPDKVQKRLVEDTVEKYVPDERHVSNLNTFYHLPRPFELFPKDHVEIKHREGKPSLSIEQVRNKHLRWITLGGQYDWTAKKYPTFERDAEGFPLFPTELSRLLGSLYNIVPEAAIINFYSPGDTLSPHQDVAEVSNADLVSVSIGCECIFYCGLSRSEEPLQLLLKSGDVVVMGGLSRKAYHGVGRVFEDTCPDYLTTGWKLEYEEWIKTKRVNMNVRQMLL